MPRIHHSLDPDERRTRRWLTVFALLGVAEFPVLVWVWLAPHFQPQRFTNHQDQIAAALRQHGVAVSQVYLDQGWPDKINNQTYGANLTVYLTSDPTAKPLIGRIECRVKKRNCWFRVSKLGIEKESLSDLIPVAPTPKPDLTWRGRVRQLLARIGIAI